MIEWFGPAEEPAEEWLVLILNFDFQGGVTNGDDIAGLQFGAVLIHAPTLHQQSVGGRIPALYPPFVTILPVPDGPPESVGIVLQGAVKTGDVLGEQLGDANVIAEGVFLVEPAHGEKTLVQTAGEGSQVVFSTNFLAIF